MTTRELEPELLMRLGRVVTTWATVEALQSEFLAFLLKADPGATYAVSQTTASSTITGWLLTLCSVRSTDDAKMASLEEALREVNELRVERNALVHGVWATTTEPGTALVQTVRLQRREVVRGELVTATDLDDLIGDILQVFEKLRVIGRSLGILNKGRHP